MQCVALTAWADCLTNYAMVMQHAVKCGMESAYLLSSGGGMAAGQTCRGSKQLALRTLANVALRC